MISGAVTAALDLLVEHPGRVLGACAVLVLLGVAAAIRDDPGA